MRGVFLALVVLLLLAGCAQKAGEEVEAPEATPAAPEVEEPKPETPAEEERVSVETDMGELLKRAKELSYTFELVETTEYQSGKKEVTTSKLWINGRNVRIEYITGQEPPFIFPSSVHIITEKGEYYVYNPENNQAVNLTPMLALAEALAGETTPFTLPEDAQVVGEETIDGRDCILLQKGDITWWVWKEYGIPLKWVSEGEVIINGVVADRYTTTGEVRNLKIEEVPLSMFELPEGAELVEAIGSQEGETGAEE